MNSESLLQDSLRQQIQHKWSVVDALENIIGIPPVIVCELCGYRGVSGSFVLYNSSCIFLGGQLLRFKCPCCDVIFGPSKMLSLSEQCLSSEYVAHYQVFSEGDSTESELRAFYLLSPSKEGSYLNYGAGSWSKSVQILNAQGWNVQAYEPHSSSENSMEVSPHSSVLEGRFDGIFSNNVLEHFRFPVDELRKIRGYLKSGGVMAHATPCYEYSYEYTRFHLFFFEGRSRKYVLDSAGFSETTFVDDGIFKCSVSVPR